MSDRRFLVRGVAAGAGAMLVAVVVLLTFVIRGRGSGVERPQSQGHVWTLRDGKATRFRWFNDRSQALRAAGVDRDT
jgi:ketosteroid isomerase-like protein